MECDHCQNKISMFSTPYKVNGFTICKECFGNNKIVTEFKARPLKKGKTVDEILGLDNNTEQPKELTASKEILITTTPTAPGSEVIETFGLVVGEAVIGANLFSDALDGVRNIVGGRSGSYQNRIRDTRDYAIEDLALNAQKIGANCVLNVKIDYETIADSMMMVTAIGTAVKLANGKNLTYHSKK